MVFLDIDSLRKEHLKFERAFRDAVDDEARAAAGYIETHVQKYPGFKPRTGNLQAATEGRVVRVGNRNIRIVGSNRKAYAEPIDLGARPHKIEGRNGGNLRFFWKKQNRWVTTRSVNHPGNRAYRFLYRATTAAGRVFVTSMSERMTQLARKF